MDRLRVDSGADRTVVHSKWVPEGARTGKTQKFLSAGKQTMVMPLANVELKLGQDVYRREVAVSDNIDYDALLGMDIIDGEGEVTSCYMYSQEPKRNVRN